MSKKFEGTRMNVVKLVISTLLVLNLMACSSSGPMKSFYGPVNTSSFELMVKQQVLNKNEELVLARKAQRTDDGLFELQIGGALILSDKRVVFARWTIDGYRYVIQDSYDYDEISSVFRTEGFFKLMKSSPGMTGENAYFSYR